MKILFVVSTLQMGGAEKVLSELANRWSGKYEVSVLTIDKGVDFFHLNESVSRYALNIERKNRYNFLPHLKIVKGIKNYTKKINPDYVISFVGKTNVFTLLALQHTKYKIIACEHSVINQFDSDKFIDFFRYGLYKKAYKIGVLSQSIKKEFIEKYKNCNRENVVVFPNALNIQETSFAQEIDLMKLCKKTKGKIVVSLGRLDAVKRFDKLIKAFSILAQKQNDVSLLIFGEGKERAYLEKLIKELKLETKIFLPGKINNIETVLTQADVFASSSLYEGQPMSIMEALYYERPVIAFDVPGTRDVIQNNITGLLIPDDDLQKYADGLAELLNDFSFSSSLGKSGKEFIKRFSPEEIDKIWETVLC